MSRCDSFLLMFCFVFQLIYPPVMDGGGQSNGIIREGNVPLDPGNPFIHPRQDFGSVVNATDHTCVIEKQRRKYHHANENERLHVPPERGTGDVRAGDMDFPDFPAYGILDLLALVSEFFSVPIHNLSYGLFDLAGQCVEVLHGYAL